MGESKNLPTVASLTKNTEIAEKNDKLNYLLNQHPPAKWIKQHPYIKNYNYIPIDKIEYLLKRIFKRYRIEIREQGQSFNGVWVTVRVHYLHPVTEDWDFHDGIGAVELQTKKGATPADMANINPGALGMAYPIAKSRAVKNACSEFGKFFGSDLNREDTLEFNTDPNLESKQEIEGTDWEMLKEAIKQERMTVGKALKLYELSVEQKEELYEVSK